MAYRAVSYGRVRDDLVHRCGLDPSVLQSGTKRRLASYLQHVTGRAWQDFPWPELCRVERRYFRALWNSGTTYALDAEVRGADGLYYRSLQNANTNHAVTQTAWWTAVDADFVRSVDYAQAGEAALGDVLGVFAADPRTTADVARYGFYLGGDGVVVEPFEAASVWLKWQERAPLFSGEDYSSGASYTAGSVVFHGGDCWLAMTTLNNVTPGTNASWVRQAVPEFMWRYAVDAGYAMYLRSENRFEDGGAAQAAANAEMGRMLARVAVHQGQTAGYTVRL